MTDRRATLLVARREASERLRQRSFQISTGVTLLIVAAVAVLGGVLGGGGPDRYQVGAHGAEAAAIAAAAQAAAPAFDARLEVRRYRDEASARAAVRDEEVDAVVLASGTVLMLDEPPTELERALQAGGRQVRAGRALRSEGLSAPEARRALDPPPLPVRALDSEGDEDERRGVAYTASLLLYLQLIVYGLWVATGVVEEKSSRVVEVLLATVRPRALLAGKVLGIGLLGLGQLLLIGVVGLGLALASGAIELDGTTLGTLAVVLVWFLFGYALYASLYATGGVLVSRQEDVQSSTTPLTVMLVVAYLLAFPTLDDPASGLARIASLVPFTAPIVMPTRLALGEASVPEAALSLALLAASVALIVPFAARIYDRAVLRMGKPVKLREAWRAAR